MYEAAVFDPASATQGTFNTQLPINGKFVVFNESNVGLSITFSDGTTGYAPAWTATLFTQPVPSPNVTWTQKSMLAGSETSISQVLIESYLPAETINGTYPASIQHNAFITNTVSTNAVTTSNVLSNESSAATLQVIDIGTTTNNKDIVINNDGSAVWKVEQGGVQHKVLTASTTGNPGQFGQSSDTLEILGKLQVDSGLIGVAASGDVINASGLDTTLSSRGSGNVVHLASAGVDNATFDSNGIHLSRGTINLLHKSISGINYGSGTTVASPSFSTIAHGLGSSIVFALAVVNSTSSTTTMGITWDNTNVYVTGFNAGVPFVWLAIAG